MKIENLSKKLNNKDLLDKHFLNRKLDASITIRVNNEVKNEFEEVCHNLGLSISSVLSLFVNSVAMTKKIPLDNYMLKNENKRNLKFGVAKGKFDVPENIDFCNDEIAEMFGV